MAVLYKYLMNRLKAKHYPLLLVEHSKHEPEYWLVNDEAALFRAYVKIWWREKGQTGVVPANQRKLLEHGSIFVMPAGFQRTHEHRIPKADHEVGTRVSLTFRRYEP